MVQISVEHVSFSYPDSKVQALKNVSFTIEKGEYIAVLGANGSGKSTLARLMAGFLQAQSGTIKTADSAGCKHRNSRRAGQSGNCILCEQDRGAISSGIVFQSPRDQIVAETVGHDTAFGPENLNLAPETVEQRTDKCLQLVDLEQMRSDKTAFLSTGQKQKLALAGIVALKPDLLVLDEAVSMVDPEVRKSILDFLDERNRQGQTIVHVTHDTDEALRARRILVMDDGCLVFDGSSSDFKKQKTLFNALFPPLVRRSAEHTVNAACAAHQQSSSKTQKQNGSGRARKIPGLSDEQTENRALCFSHVDFAYGPDKAVFTDFSLNIYEGTLTALMGPSGVGKSTFFELACGLLKPNQGKVCAKYKPVLALQDCESALFEEFAADDVAFGSKNEGISGDELKKRVRRAMDICDLPFETFADRRTYTLSGGEKRKLSLAGIVVLDSNLYLFDEPTAGLDPKARLQVLNVLADLASSGKTVIFSTHRAEEGAFASRLILFNKGKVTEKVQVSSADAASVISEKKSPDGCGGLSRIAPIDTSMLDKLRHTEAGVYRSENTPLHRMNAVYKILLFLTLFIVSLCIQNPYALSVCTLFSVCYAFLSHFSLKKLGLTFCAFLPYLVFFAALQFLLFPPIAGENVYFSLYRFSITDSKIQVAVVTLLHVAAAIPCVIGFMYSTDTAHILEGLKKILHPLDFVGIKSKYISFTLFSVFRFIPVLAEDASQIVKTQLIRGGFTRKKGFFKRLRGMLPLFVPLVVQTFRRAEAFANTLSARRF